MQVEILFKVARFEVTSHILDTHPPRLTSSQMCDPPNPVRDVIYGRPLKRAANWRPPRAEKCLATPLKTCNFWIALNLIVKNHLQMICFVIMWIDFI